MLARMKHGFLVGLVWFLAASGAYAASPEEGDVRTALLTPSREVVYVTRSPLAGAVAKPQKETPLKRKKGADRVDHAPSTGQDKPPLGK
ncbi:MAG: hypothetical protein AAF999_01915 [Pseudomonadota bacterium]